MVTGVNREMWDMPLEMPFGVRWERRSLIGEPGHLVVHSRQLDDRRVRVIDFENNHATDLQAWRFDQLLEATGHGTEPFLLMLPHENQFMLTDALVAGFRNNDAWSGWQRNPTAAFSQMLMEDTAATAPPGETGTVSRLRGLNSARRSPSVFQEFGRIMPGKEYTVSFRVLETLSEFEEVYFWDGTTKKRVVFEWQSGSLVKVIQDSGLRGAATDLGSGWWRMEATLVADTYPGGGPIRAGWSSAVYDDGVFGPQLLADPEDLTTAQWTSSATVTADQADDPFFQNMAADEVNDNDGGSVEDVYQDIPDGSLTNGEDYTLGFYLTAGTSNRAVVEFSHGGAAPWTRADINFTTKAVNLTSSGGGTHLAHIEDLDVTLPQIPEASWFDVGATVTYDNTGTPGLRAKLIPTNNSAGSTGTVMAWGARAHAQSDAGTPVKTPNRYAYRGGDIFGPQVVYGSSPLAYRRVGRNRKSPLLVVLDGDSFSSTQSSGVRHRISGRMVEEVY